MQEEIKNKELEKILNEVNRNFSDKPWNDKLAEIFNREDGATRNPHVITKDICTFYTEWGKNYVRFYGEFKEKARSMKELKPLIDYLDKEGYEWV